MRGQRADFGQPDQRETFFDKWVAVYLSLSLSRKKIKLQVSLPVSLSLSLFRETFFLMMHGMAYMYVYIG
jgi:hypothetical protein